MTALLPKSFYRSMDNWYRWHVSSEDVTIGAFYRVSGLEPKDEVVDQLRCDLVVMAGRGDRRILAPQIFMKRSSGSSFSNPFDIPTIGMKVRARKHHVT